MREEGTRQVADTREEATRLRGGMNGLRGDVNRQLLYLVQKSDRQFTWLAGTQLAVLLAVVGALAGAYFR